MLTYRGGYRADKGTYWDLRNGRRFDVAEEAVLPGDDRTMFLKMPAPLMLLCGPVIGLAYVILLPFIGITVVAGFAGRKLFEATANLIGKSLSFGWRPRNAYLSGKKKDRSKRKE